MKKTIALITLLIVLITMSSAYAIWTDSVSTTVSARNAVINVQYTYRTDNSNYMSYTVQSSGQLGSGNPYDYIQENISTMYYGSTYTAQYTVTNTGTVPMTFDGIDVSGFSVSGWFASTIADAIRIQYSVNNANVSPVYNYSTTISDVNNHSGVTFTNHNNNILEPGESCTLTVSYYRVTSGWLANLFSVEMVITDQISCSVYR